MGKLTKYLQKKIHSIQLSRLQEKMGIQRLKDGSLVETYQARDQKETGENTYLFLYKVKCFQGEYG